MRMTCKARPKHLAIYWVNSDIIASNGNMHLFCCYRSIAQFYSENLIPADANLQNYVF
jgi:hypothetical protein